MNKCLECKKETKNSKFCNHSCAAKFNNRKRIITIEQKQKTSNTVKAGWLNETLEQRAKRIENMKTAMNMPETKKRHNEGLRKSWNEKKAKLIKKLPFNELPYSLIKQILYKENKNTCCICGYTYSDSKTGKGPFDIHHKNADKNNRNKDNLQVLCLNCHWKTDNYRFRGRTHTKETREKIAKRFKKK